MEVVGRLKIALEEADLEPVVQKKTAVVKKDHEARLVRLLTLKESPLSFSFE